MEPTRHVCGQCKDEWLTEQEYVEHICPETLATPADPAHHGEDFVAIQRAALTRGMRRAQQAGDHEQITRNKEALDQL